MRLHRLVKKARREVLSEKTDICGLLFDQAKPQHACRLFLNFLKEHQGGCSRRELSQFARDLQAGLIEEGFTYGRSSFYRTIHRQLLQLGFLGLEPRFDLEKDIQYKYVPVAQPIPKRGPDGWSFAKLSWILCKRWNEEFKLFSEISFEE